MRDHGGAIVNISSRSGIVGIPGAAAYASSKAAVRNHTKSVALYCAARGYGIRWTSSSRLDPHADVGPEPRPGRRSRGPDRGTRPRSATGANGPARRRGPGGPLFASEASAYVTGAELHINGGILAGAAAAPPLPSAPRETDSHAHRWTSHPRRFARRRPPGDRPCPDAGSRRRPFAGVRRCRPHLHRLRARRPRAGDGVGSHRRRTTGAHRAVSASRTR